MFEIRLRILDVREKDTDPNSFLGIVEGFPQVLVHATTVEEARHALVNALEEHLRRLMDHEATRLEVTILRECEALGSAWVAHAPP